MPEPMTFEAAVAKLRAELPEGQWCLCRQAGFAEPDDGHPPGPFDEFELRVDADDGMKTFAVLHGRLDEAVAAAIDHMRCEELRERDDAPRVTWVSMPLPPPVCHRCLGTGVTTPGGETCDCPAGIPF